MYTGKDLTRSFDGACRDGPIRINKCWNKPQHGVMKAGVGYILALLLLRTLIISGGWGHIK